VWAGKAPAKAIRWYLLLHPYGFKINQDLQLSGTRPAIRMSYDTFSLPTVVYSTVPSRGSAYPKGTDWIQNPFKLKSCGNLDRMLFQLEAKVNDIDNVKTKPDAPVQQHSGGLKASNRNILPFLYLRWGLTSLFLRKKFQSNWQLGISVHEYSSTLKCQRCERPQLEGTPAINVNVAAE